MTLLMVTLPRDRISPTHKTLVVRLAPQPGQDQEASSPMLPLHPLKAHMVTESRLRLSLHLLRHLHLRHLHLRVPLPLGQLLNSVTMRQMPCFTPSPRMNSMTMRQTNAGVIIHFLEFEMIP